LGFPSREPIRGEFEWKKFLIAGEPARVCVDLLENLRHEADSLEPIRVGVETTPFVASNLSDIDGWAPFSGNDFYSGIMNVLKEDSLDTIDMLPYLPAASEPRKVATEITSFKVKAGFEQSMWANPMPLW
jgi:hypothetical protein